MYIEVKYITLYYTIGVWYYTFVFIITFTSDRTLQVKKIISENRIIQLEKPKTKHHPTLTSDKYAYGEVLHITADISDKTFRKAKICEEIKIIGKSVALEIKLKPTYKRKTQQ